MADWTLLLSQWFRHRGCTTRRYFRPLSLSRSQAPVCPSRLWHHPFFGTLRVRLKLVPGSVPTMATDGRRIVYNPAFVEGLKPAELERVLAHEVLHCALAHHCGRGQREPELWSEAADYAVNTILLGSELVLPAGVLVDPAFADLSAEETYARLMKMRESARLPNANDDQPGPMRAHQDNDQRPLGPPRGSAATTDTPYTSCG